MPIGYNKPNTPKTRHLRAAQRTPVLARPRPAGSPSGTWRCRCGKVISANAARCLACAQVVQ